jgi:hypothetical protein
MAEIESLLLGCPKCTILIDVQVEDFRQGREFQCPICCEMIRFDLPAEDKEMIIAEMITKQQRELKKAFRLAFGDL